MTKIKSTPYPEDGEIGIHKMSITYTQNADTNSERDEQQYLTIETEDVPDGSDLPYFFNIKIEDCDHWSIDEPSELSDLVEDFIAMLKLKKRENK